MTWSDPNATLEPGEGFILRIPVGVPPYTLTFEGCEPVCALPCAPPLGQFALMGGRSVGTAKWSDVYSCPPQCGAQVDIWNGNSYDTYIYFNGFWWLYLNANTLLPQEPELAVGQSAYFSMHPNPACCTDPLAPPIIASCPTNRTLYANSGCVVNVPDMTSEMVASDTCSTITITQNPAAGSTLNGPGQHPVVFTVCDTCNICVTCTNYLSVDCLPGTININVWGTNMVINWSGLGTIQSSDSLNPPITWVDMTNTSPYTNATPTGQRFYRLRR